jgi:hypothetical protein
MKLLIMHFSPVPCHLHLRKLSCLPAPSDHVSHPYQTTGTIILAVSRAAVTCTTGSICAPANESSCRLFVCCVRWENTWDCCTGWPFYRGHKRGSCNGTSRRTQAYHAIKLPRSGSRYQGQPMFDDGGNSWKTVPLVFLFTGPGLAGSRAARRVARGSRVAGFLRGAPGHHPAALGRASGQTERVCGAHDVRGPRLRRGGE